MQEGSHLTGRGLPLVTGVFMGGKRIGIALVPLCQHLPHEFDVTIRLAHYYSTLINSFTGPHFLLSFVLNFIYSSIQMSLGIQQ